MKGVGIFLKILSAIEKMHVRLYLTGKHFYAVAMGIIESCWKRHTRIESK